MDEDEHVKYSKMGVVRDVLRRIGTRHRVVFGKKKLKGFVGSNFPAETEIGLGKWVVGTI